MTTSRDQSDAGSMDKHRGRMTLSLPGDPTKHAEAARHLNLIAMTGWVFAGAVSRRLSGIYSGTNGPQSALAYVEDLIRRLDPRDPMEEMLVSQAVLAHARVLHLTNMAQEQTLPEDIRTMNDYADRASNTFRRLMLALAEYRRPQKSGDSFTAIHQANIAGQQVVMNSEPKKESATNEQGSSDANATHDDTRQTKQTLPADAGGSGIPPSLGGPHKAVGAVHRAEDG